MEASRHSSAVRKNPPDSSQRHTSVGSELPREVLGISQRFIGYPRALCALLFVCRNLR